MRGELKINKFQHKHRNYSCLNVKMSVFKMNLFGLRLRKTQAFQSEIQNTRFNKVSDSVREAGAHRTYLGPVTLETKKIKVV